MTTAPVKGLSMVDHPLAAPPIRCSVTGGRMSCGSMADALRAEHLRPGLAAFDRHARRYRGIRELAQVGYTGDKIAS